MIAQTGDLTDERRTGNFLLVAFPILPAFPRVATRPTGHDQNAQTVRLLKKFIAIEVPFQANGIQSHIANVGEVSIQPTRTPSHNHALLPTPPPNPPLPPIPLA